MNLSRIGRIVYALPFVVFGLFHFMNAPAMAGMVPIPGGLFWVYVTGLAHILAAVSFISGKRVRLAGQLLALMLVIFAFSIQLPGAMGGDQASMSNFLKDIALAGGALAIAGGFERRA